MKEATGELNMTVITVVAIAAVAAFFYAFVWPNIRASLILTTACNSVNASGDYQGEGVQCWNFTCDYDGHQRTCDNNSDRH